MKSPQLNAPVPIDLQSNSRRNEQLTDAKGSSWDLLQGRCDIHGAFLSGEHHRSQSPRVNASPSPVYPSIRRALAHEMIGVVIDFVLDRAVRLLPVGNLKLLRPHLFGSYRRRVWECQEYEAIFLTTILSADSSLLWYVHSLSPQISPRNRQGTKLLKAINAVPLSEQTDRQTRIMDCCRGKADVFLSEESYCLAGTKEHLFVLYSNHVVPAQLRAARAHERLLRLKNRQEAAS